MRDHADAPKLDPLLQMFRAVLIYGALAFAAGFVFGVIRELLLIPWLGRSLGRGLEFAIMVALTLAIARMAMQRLASRTPGRLLALGIGGMFVLLALDALFALYVVQLPLEKYLESFNIVKGEPFPWGLAVMTIAPLLLERWMPARD